MSQKAVLISGLIGLVFGVLFSGTLGLDFFKEDVVDTNENQQQVEENNDDETTLTDEFNEKYNLDDSIYLPISGDEAYSKIDNDDTFILYIGRHTCPYCQQFVPVLLEAAENEGLEQIFHVNSIDSNNSEFVSMEDVTFTPTTYIVVDGEIVEEIIGFRSLTEMQTLIDTHFN